MTFGELRFWFCVGMRAAHELANVCREPQTDLLEEYLKDAPEDPPIIRAAFRRGWAWARRGHFEV